MAIKIWYEIEYFDLREINNDLHTTKNELVLEKEPDNHADFFISLIQMWDKTSPNYYQFNSIKIYKTENLPEMERHPEWLDQPFVFDVHRVVDNYLSIGLQYR